MMLDSSRGSSMPIRAVAVAHEQANAVGTVELTCTHDRLRIDFLQVSAFHEGYVPYPSTSSFRVEVPYEDVARVSSDDEGLIHLVVDRSYTPFNKLVLGGLAHDRHVDHVSTARRRRMVESWVLRASLVLWIPLVLFLHALAPGMSATWQFGIALTVAGLVATFRRAISAQLLLLGPRHQHTSQELLSELKWRLPPHKVQLPDTWTPPTSQASEVDDWHPDSLGLGNLKGLFATAGIVAAVSVVAILVGKNLLLSPSTRPEPDPWKPMAVQAEHVEDRTHLPGSPPPATIQATQERQHNRPTPVALVPCSCARADSPLWANGIPRMSVLVRNRPGKTSYDHPSVYPEIAVVNNSNKDLKDIVMIVDFLLGPRDGHKARKLGKKDLFWEGILPPGKAVKWRVKGRGDDFIVTSFVDGQLGDKGIDPAPADAFYDLATTAHTPMVRVHGAKMLAYLGDRRTIEVVKKLRQEHRAEQTPILQQIEEASESLRVCGIHIDREAVSQGRKDELPVSACIFNAGSSPVQQPFVEATASLDGRQASTGWSIPTTLAPNRGVLTRGSVPLPPTEDGSAEDAVITLRAQH